MPMLFRSLVKANSILFAAQLDLPDAIGESAKDVEFAIDQRQSGCALEVVRRLRLENPLLGTVQIVDQHLVCSWTYEIKPFRLRIDGDILKTPASRLPFQHRPL